MSANLPSHMKNISLFDSGGWRVGSQATALATGPATLTSQIKRRFLFVSEGWPPPFRVKQKIDVSFGAEGRSSISDHPSPIIHHRSSITQHFFKIPKALILPASALDPFITCLWCSFEIYHTNSSMRIFLNSSCNVWTLPASV